MTPKVLTFAPHAEMVILIYIMIKRALRPARRARNFHTGYIYGIPNAFENRAVARRLI